MMLPGDFSPEKKARERFLARQRDLREAANTEWLLGKVGARYSVRLLKSRQHDKFTSRFEYVISVDELNDNDRKFVNGFTKGFGLSKLFPEIDWLHDGFHVTVMAPNEFEARKSLDRAIKSVGVTGR